MKSSDHRRRQVVSMQARAVSGVLGSDPGSLPAPRADILSDKVPEVPCLLLARCHFSRVANRTLFVACMHGYERVG